MSVRCSRCGDVRRRAMERPCPAGGICDYGQADDRIAWMGCRYRGERVDEIGARELSAGCGHIALYACTLYGEIVPLSLPERAVEALQRRVPAFTGRTCRSCSVGPASRSGGQQDEAEPGEHEQANQHEQAPAAG